MNHPASITSARNVHAVGRNYSEHALELGNPIPREPVLFAISPCSLTTAELLRFPRELGPVHFELEVVLRIGEDLDVGQVQGPGCISHMALGIDFTARDLQKDLKQRGLPWHRAKNFANAAWVGPLRSEIPSAPFSFSLAQNGQVRQRGSTGQMIFPFPEILTYINRTMTLQEGDLIFTGTPSGVGPLAAGDQLHLVCGALATNLTLSIGAPLA